MLNNRGVTFRNVLGDLAAAMPQTVTVTPEERQAIERVSHIFLVKKMLVATLE